MKTYVALRVHPECENKIKAYMDCFDIPVAYPKQEQRRHCTLFSSEKDFVNEFIAYPDRKYFAVPTDFQFFPTRTGSNCLVLRLDCPELVSRHNQIKTLYDAEDIHGEYKPHISFSYDVGNRTLEDICKHQFNAPIILSEEYCEAFDMNWAEKKE